MLEVASPGPKGRCRTKRALHSRLRAGKPNSSIGLCLVTCSPAGVTNYHFKIQCIISTSATIAPRSVPLFYVTHRAPGSISVVTWVSSATNPEAPRTSPTSPPRSQDISEVGSCLGTCVEIRSPTPGSNERTRRFPVRQPIHSDVSANSLERPLLSVA